MGRRRVACAAANCSGQHGVCVVGIIVQYPLTGDFSGFNGRLVGEGVKVAFGCQPREPRGLVKCPAWARCPLFPAWETAAQVLVQNYMEK
jgi:hypothetical protein